MESAAEEFSQIVKTVRDQLHLSQEDLAREIGVSFATINRWENGRTKPFRLARQEFDKFCKRKSREGALHISTR
jgi:DNA-binding transcriptional regulator YiaG